MLSGIAVLSWGAPDVCPVRSPYAGNRHVLWWDAETLAEPGPSNLHWCLLFPAAASHHPPSPSLPPATVAPVTESLMPHPNSVEGGKTDRHRKLQLYTRKVSSDLARRNDCPLQPKEDQSLELFFETLLVYSSPNPRIQAT